MRRDPASMHHTLTRALGAIIFTTMLAANMPGANAFQVGADTADEAVDSVQSAADDATGGAVGDVLDTVPSLPGAQGSASLVVDFKQCSNNNTTGGSAAGPHDCTWISSIIQSSNSVYFEGMSVPQRTVLSDIPSTIGNVHTLTFDHQATKSGIHAYDWLTSYAQAEAAAAAAGWEMDDLAGEACDENIGPPASLGATCAAVRSSGNSATVDVPDDPFMSKDGSTQSRIDAYEATFGNRTIELFGDAPISNASLTLTHTVADGGDTGDSDIQYELTWTSESDTVLLEMAGHLAKAADADGWGDNLGSSSISGGPYHFNLRQLDGASLGAQDNQIKGADILVQAGKIRIVKQTSPSGDPQTFDFTGEIVATLGDGESADADVDPGTYSVSESVPAGWELTDITCDDMDSSGSGTTATFNVDEGEVVTCTFTNTKQGTIIVEKQTNPADDPAQFTFTGDAAGTIGDNGQIVVDDLSPGTYTSTESALAGWDLTSIVCDDGASATPSTSAGATATFNLDPGETVRCTFTNTKRGTVVVNKTTNGQTPTATWTFNISGGPDDIDVTDETDATGHVDFDQANPLKPGTYTVCELGIPAGFDTSWQLDGTPTTATNPDDPEDLGNRCITFNVGAGQDRVISVDNIRPGGEPRTMGYWKNWSTCDGRGKQEETAAKNGGPAEGFFLLDDTLPLTLWDDGEGNSYAVTTCEEGIALLDKRDTVTGQKRSSDAAYALASQYVAALANQVAGAEFCQDLADALDDTEALLESIGFDGTGSYLPPFTPDVLTRMEALALAETLDTYNNGGLC